MERGKTSGAVGSDCVIILRQEVIQQVFLECLQRARHCGEAEVSSWNCCGHSWGAYM